MSRRWRKRLALRYGSRTFRRHDPCPVGGILASELPPDQAAIHERFAASHGPLRSQVAVFADAPAARRHPLPMLIELRDVATLPKRYLTTAIVGLAKPNECHYCVAHYK